MSYCQYILYNATILFIVIHFFESANDKEYREPIYFNSFPFWLYSSGLIIAYTLYVLHSFKNKNSYKNLHCIITGIGGSAFGRGAARGVRPAHRKGDAGGAEALCGKSLRRLLFHHPPHDLRRQPLRGGFSRPEGQDRRRAGAADQPRRPGPVGDDAPEQANPVKERNGPQRR